MAIFLEVLLLALIQGIGEFLPISSSGHVVVLSEVFNQTGCALADTLTINIVLHLGTLLAILVFFRQRIAVLLGEDRRVIALVVVGSIPAAVVGFTLRLYTQAALESALLAGVMFLVTGVMLQRTRRTEAGKLTCRELTFRQSLLIGGFQAIAILPGVSRSGSTIVAGLAAGLNRAEAATFSFLLAIPAIAGAGVVELVSLVNRSTPSTPPVVLFVGAIVSFAVGLASLFWLIRFLERDRLHWFAWWLFLLGPVVVVWQILSR